MYSIAPANLAWNIDVAYCNLTREMKKHTVFVALPAESRIACFLQDVRSFVCNCLWSVTEQEVSNEDISSVTRK